jgi:hypothetical protein
MSSSKFQEMENTILPDIIKFAEEKHSPSPIGNNIMIQAWKTETCSNKYAKYIKTPFGGDVKQFQKECQEMKQFIGYIGQQHGLKTNYDVEYLPYMWLCDIELERTPNALGEIKKNIGKK